MPQYSSTTCTVRVGPVTVADVVEVSVIGDIDRDDASMLTHVSDYLTDLGPARIVVELGELSFAGSVLPNWLAGMRHRLPDRSSVALRHPLPMVRCILEMTDMANLVI